MKRLNGLWYVKHMSVWLVAGETVETAIQYKMRLIEETK